MSILENNKKIARDYRSCWHGGYFDLYKELKIRFARFKGNKFNIKQSISAGSLLPFEGAIFYILEEADKLQAQVDELTRQRDFYKNKYDATLKSIVG